ncbi:MAG: EamA family transporter, partial [Acidobacteria bacterium]|nr:EamA family transporter [Acidobacteriota bacterium]
AASLLIALNPLLTLLLAVRFLGEPFSRRRLLGTAVTFLGLAVVVLLGRVGGSGGTWIPLAKFPYALLVLGGPLSWAVATVIIKPALENHSPLVGRSPCGRWNGAPPPSSPWPAPSWPTPCGTSQSSTGTPRTSPCSSTSTRR